MSLYFTLEPGSGYYANDGYTLRHTFMDYGFFPPPAPVYLFLQEIRYNETDELCWPEIFSAWDDAGERRISDDELANYLDHFELRPEDLKLRMIFYDYHWPWYVYEAIREVKEKLGFDPASDEMAKYLGLPEIHWHVEPSEEQSKCEVQGA